MDQFMRRRHAAGPRFFMFPTRGIARPIVESLEARALLTTVVVNTVVDALFPVSSNLISLRSALATASAKLNLNGFFTLNNLATTGSPLAGTTIDIERSKVFISYAGPTADPLALI